MIVELCLLLELIFAHAKNEKNVCAKSKEIQFFFPPYISLQSMLCLRITTHSSWTARTVTSYSSLCSCQSSASHPFSE